MVGSLKLDTVRRTRRIIYREDQLEKLKGQRLFSTSNRQYEMELYPVEKYFLSPILFIDKNTALQIKGQANWPKTVGLAALQIP
jgi:hypothetical protein